LVTNKESRFTYLTGTEVYIVGVIIIIIDCALFFLFCLSICDWVRYGLMTTSSSTVF